MGGGGEEGLDGCCRVTRGEKEDRTPKLKRFRFLPEKFPFFSGLFPDSFRKKAEKTSETDRKKAETFPEKKRNLLSFTLGRKEWLA